MRSGVNALLLRPVWTFSLFVLVTQFVCHRQLLPSPGEDCGLWRKAAGADRSEPLEMITTRGAQWPGMRWCCRPSECPRWDEMGPFESPRGALKDAFRSFGIVPQCSRIQTESF